MGGSLNRSPLMSRNQNFMNSAGNKNVYDLLCKIHENSKSEKENVKYSNGRSSKINKSEGFSKSTRFCKNTTSF